MVYYRRWAFIILAIVLVLTIVSGCQQLSNVIKPKPSASAQTDSCAVSQCKYLSIYSNFRYNQTGSQAANLDQETGFFDVINLKLTWNGQAFSGSSNAASGWQGGESSPSKKTGECMLSGSMSRDMKTIESLKFQQSIIWQSGDSQAGSFEIVNIPYLKTNDFRDSKGACKNCHLAFDRRGLTAQDSVKQWELQGTRSNGSLWKINRLVWQENNGLTVTFKYSNCDNN
jgi:hypothetical protein